jgi:putative FmdB family regulatory protein
MGSTQMPTYEYACSKCGHHFDQFQSMRDEPLRKCPKCHKMALKRLIGGGAGLIFKGSGFYITDYKNKGMAKAAASESAPAASPKADKPAPAVTTKK